MMVIQVPTGLPIPLFSTALEFSKPINKTFALSIEASELDKLFLWKSSPEDIASVNKAEC